MKIILFNGPPHSGKDTLAGLVQQQVDNSEIVKFAAPLKSVVKELYCNGSQLLFDLMDSPERKNLPDDQFFGISCRQAQINVSEVFLKKVHGERVFGKILAATIKKKAEAGIENFLVSDSGFEPEAAELIDQFGAENIVLLKLIRQGTSYEGDSRSYIDLSKYGVKTYEVVNVEGMLPVTVNNILTLIKQGNV